MKIEIGKTYHNKTLKFLLPSLKLLGTDFRAKLNSVQTLAFGVHDTSLDGTPYEDQRLVYILIDKLVKPLQFNNFVAWIRNQEFYAADYAFDNLETGRMHMVAVTYPDKYGDAYDKFIKGKYSKMYVKDEVKVFFDAGKEEAKGIINKTKDSGEIHVKNLNATYNSSITLKCLLTEGGEHDFPPQKHEEIFNCEKPSEIV